MCSHYPNFVGDEPSVFNGVTVNNSLSLLLLLLLLLLLPLYLLQVSVTMPRQCLHNCQCQYHCQY